jgi:ribosomal protein S18 acetylase RimI-like enzyme
MQPDYAGPVRTAASIGELDRPGYLALLDDLLAIYAAAMAADPGELPGRRAIMERHAANARFRAVVATSGQQPRVVGFAYGFHGYPGQWWHDVVRSGVVARAGDQAASAWLDDAFEIAEVHVRPDHQAQGIGRRMVFALAEGRPERSALLSTRDAETPARRLYRSLGFIDLLTDFLFPGGGPAYAVMGAPLPLSQAGPGRDR